MIAHHVRHWYGVQCNRCGRPHRPGADDGWHESISDAIEAAAQDGWQHMAYASEARDFCPRCFDEWEAEQSAKADAELRRNDGYAR